MTSPFRRQIAARSRHRSAHTPLFGPLGAVSDTALASVQRRFACHTVHAMVKTPSTGPRNRLKKKPYM